jgi:hypothetical protein
LPGAGNARVSLLALLVRVIANFIIDFTFDMALQIDVLLKAGDHESDL